MVRALPPLFIALIFGMPAVAAGLPIVLAPHPAGALVGLFLAPAIYAVAFVVIAGLLSLPFQSGIVPGRFPRDLKHPVYRKRRLYGLCWTCVYYFKPIYFLCLTLYPLKWLTFRLFGYRGNLDFTIYPDTWIRDLPLLSLGKGAYIANRATLGTNIAMSNGKIIVDRVVLGERATVGHLAMVGPGVHIGPWSEVGVGSAIGMYVHIGAGSFVSTNNVLNHYSVVGDNCRLGNVPYIGARSKISDGVHVAPGTMVPAKTQITSQSDADRLSSRHARLYPHVVEAVSEVASGTYAPGERPEGGSHVEA